MSECEVQSQLSEPIMFCVMISLFCDACVVCEYHYQSKKTLLGFRLCLAFDFSEGSKLPSIRRSFALVATSRSMRSHCPPQWRVRRQYRRAVVVAWSSPRSMKTYSSHNFYHTGCWSLVCPQKSRRECNDSATVCQSSHAGQMISYPN